MTNSEWFVSIINTLGMKIRGKEGFNLYIYFYVGNEEHKIKIDRICNPSAFQVNFLKIWKTFKELNINHEIDGINEITRRRIEEELPPVPRQSKIDCSFCERKNLENFFTGKDTGAIACPDCFKKRVDKHLAKGEK